jgi:glycosyltransferase involved in cell wall biosynthesis
MTSRPDIVFISANNPYGDVYGGGLRTRVAIEALSFVGDVTLVPITRNPWSAEAIEETARRLTLARRVPFHHAASADLTARLRRNLLPRCMDTDGFYVDESDRQYVEERVAVADLVWIHRLPFADILRRWRWPRTVLDIDDLASRFESAQAAVSSGAKRIRALWRAALWRRREKLLGERFDHVVLCSEEDRLHLRIKARIHVIANTFDDVGVTAIRTPAAVPRFGFIGNCEYEPNGDAVDWFCRRVWPEIERRLPGSELRIIGRGSAEFLRARHLPGVGLGYVEDPTAEMATWMAMIVPIRFGGGTRIKISEAFVRRIPVVSTRLGAFGYDVMNDRELLLVDEPTEFAQACVRLVHETGLAERLTEQASTLYRTKYSIAAVRQQVVTVADEVLRERTAVDFPPMRTHRS